MLKILTDTEIDTGGVHQFAVDPPCWMPNVQAH